MRSCLSKGLLILLLAGCGPEEPGKGDPGTTAPSTSSTTETGDTGFFVPTTSTTTVSTNMVTLRFQEYLSAELIAGASVEFLGQTGDTNAGGEVHFPLQPGALYEARLHPAGHGPVRMYGLLGPWRHIEASSLPSDDSKQLLATMFGAPLYPGAGILSVTVYAGEPVARFPLAQARIGLDVPFELALVENRDDDRGFTPGDTTLDGQNATVVFAGVPAGPVSPTLTPPDGYTCTLDPPTLELDDGGYTNVRYYCVP